MGTQKAAETLLTYIHDGGPPIMWTLVGMFVLGLAIFLWRLIVILFAMFNTKRLYKKVYEALQNKESGLEEASEICSKTPGPVATIIHAGLSRVHKGIDHVEKAVESAGAVEMAFLENGLVWLATIANIAPMLGFFGTVVGMIIAFRNIAAAGDVEPSIVANGISIALITTAGGLLVAIPIQTAYNFCVYLIERVTVSMEENASRFIETLVDLGYDINTGESSSEVNA
ncbi:MAG TPA: MotA/TolQ/ExbB proton channel family protein [Anaerolineae bacterium]|nr:MotA/TolQ/ExbB proton channel family protein [Anaerolineae bacterium]